jgi:hypothetical protein
VRLVASAHHAHVRRNCNREKKSVFSLRLALQGQREEFYYIYI